MTPATLASRPTASRGASGREQRTGLARGRLVLLLGGGLGLLVGLWTGLGRVDAMHSGGPVAHHGIVMVLGFLGTLIGLERAVAVGRRWAYVAPALSGAAVVWLLVGGPPLGAGLAFTAAGAIVTAVYAITLRHQPEPFMFLMAAGGLAWLVAAGAWTLGVSVVRATPLLAAFLVLTIVGERLELSRLRFPTRASTRRLLAAAAVFGAGSLVALVDHRAGLVIGGIGLVAQTVWLVRNDVARVTIRRPGLPRFAAVCMLAGYLWLGVSGLLWIALGLRIGGPLMHDAALHSLFLGFVISMVMGHAPIILPAVLRVPLPYRPSAWVPLLLLHTSVAWRIATDLAGSSWGRGMSVHGNTTALLLFVAIAVVTVRRARAAERREAAPAASTTSPRTTRTTTPPAPAGDDDRGGPTWND